MKVDPEAVISHGITFRQLRDFLKRHGDYISPTDVVSAFGKSKNAAPALISALIRDGYLEELDQDGRHPVGQQGMQLANASFLKRMSRPQAKELLTGVIDRAKEINARAELTHYVEELHVFGSYLSDAADLGDVDIAVKLGNKDEDGSDIVQRSRERARASGRANLSFFDILTFGEREVRQILKARKGRISLHDMNDLNLPGIESQLVYTRRSTTVES